MKTLRFACVIAAALAVAVGVSPCRAGGGCDQAGCEIGGRDGGCGGPHCSRCGRHGACAVCCLVKTEKKGKVECYGFECKENCLARCGSQCACTECVTCGPAGCSAISGIAKAYYGTRKPCCGKPKCVKELV